MLQAVRNRDVLCVETSEISFLAFCCGNRQERFPRDRGHLSGPSGEHVTQTSNSTVWRVRKPTAEQEA